MARGHWTALQNSWRVVERWVPAQRTRLVTDSMVISTSCPEHMLGRGQPVYNIDTEHTSIGSAAEGRMIGAYVLDVENSDGVCTPHQSMPMVEIACDYY